VVGDLLSNPTGGIIGIGIDLVDIPRVDRLLARHGARAMEKLLTDSEIAYVRGMARPTPHLAARIAAKEAVFKALQSLPDAASVSWHDLEVTRDPGGRPRMSLLGRAATLARRHGPLEVHLSLSHAQATAGAVAVVLRPSKTQRTGRTRGTRRTRRTPR
jgi:holo-[acyl-carrier protein] synthase